MEKVWPRSYSNDVGSDFTDSDVTGRDDFGWFGDFDDGESNHTDSEWIRIWKIHALSRPSIAKTSKQIHPVISTAMSDQRRLVDQGPIHRCGCRRIDPLPSLGNRKVPFLWNAQSTVGFQVISDVVVTACEGLSRGDGSLQEWSGDTLFLTQSKRRCPRHKHGEFDGSLQHPPSRTTGKDWTPRWIFSGQMGKKLMGDSVFLMNPLERLRSYEPSREEGHNNISLPKEGDCVLYQGWMWGVYQSYFEGCIWIDQTVKSCSCLTLEGASKDEQASLLFWKSSLATFFMVFKVMIICYDFPSMYLLSFCVSLFGSDWNPLQADLLARNCAFNGRSFFIVSSQSWRVCDLLRSPNRWSLWPRFGTNRGGEDHWVN